MRVTRSELASSAGFAPQLVRIIFHNASAAAGEGYKVDLHWQNAGDEPADRNYWIFVHFRPEDSLDEPYRPGGFSWDFPPALETSRWQTGFVVKEENCYFRIPEDAGPGRYMVLLGLFDRDGEGRRVPLLNRSRDIGGRRFRVGWVTVAHQPGGPSRLLAYRLVWRVREPEERPALREPKYLSHGRLAAGFDPDRPIVRGWRIGGKETGLGGDEALRGPEAQFRDLEDGRLRSSLAVGADWTYNCRITSHTAAYRCRLKWKQRDVATMDLRCRMWRGGLQIRLASVTEHKGFHLISVTLPSLVSVGADTPGAALAVPSLGGMLVNIADSARHREVHRQAWEEPLRSAVVACKEASAAITTASADDCVVSEVYEAGHKRGGLGVQFVTRIQAEDEQFEFVPRKLSECEISISQAQNGAAATWLSGASVLSGAFRCKPDPAFRSSLVYRILMSDKSGAAVTSVDQATELIRRVSALTLGARQIVYLSGWEGIPGSEEPAAGLGDRKGLADLALAASSANARIGLQIDGDQISTAADDYDASLVALGGHGEMQPAGDGPPGQRFFVSAGAYLESGAAERRVVRLKEICPEAGETVFVALASGADGLYDHNPRVRAGADESLSARRAALDIWRRHGFTVCGDGLTAALAGAYSHFLSACRRQEGGPYSHASPIPFVSAVLHGRLTWGGSYDPEMGEAGLLLFGGAVTEVWTAETPDETISDRYYLLWLPWSKTAGLAMADYRCEGSVHTVTYEGGDTVEADLERGGWRVVCAGYTICQNGLTTVPAGRNELVVYSREERDVSIPLPPGWEAGGRIWAELRGEAGAPQHVACSVGHGRLELAVPARRPVVVFRR